MKQRLLYLALCASVLTAVASQAESWTDTSQVSTGTDGARPAGSVPAWSRLSARVNTQPLPDSPPLRVSPDLAMAASAPPAASRPASGTSQPDGPTAPQQAVPPDTKPAAEPLSLWARLLTWITVDSPKAAPTTSRNNTNNASQAPWSLGSTAGSMRPSGPPPLPGSPGLAPATLCHGMADAAAVSTTLVSAVGADVSALDKQVAASAAHALLSRYKSSLGIQGTIGLNGRDRVAICLSNSASPVGAAGGYQGLVLVPLSTHLAAGRTQAQWQQALAHELVKVVQAQLSQDTQDRHLLPRWFQEGMAAYLAQEAYLDTTDKVSAWVSQYNSSGACGPLEMADMSDLSRCGVQQEASTYGPAYASVMHLLFDATSSGGAGASTGLLSNVLTDMASGSTFAASFTNHLGPAASVGWHLNSLTPGY